MPSTPHIVGIAPSRARHESLVAPSEEMARLRDRYPNVLIIGPAAAVETVLAEMNEMLRPPTRSFRAGGHDPLPLTPSHGTLIVRDVAMLTVVEQLELSEWLARTAGVSQVVATNPEPLLPLVERGRFLEVLYYRLNLAYFEVADPL